MNAPLLAPAFTESAVKSFLDACGAVGGVDEYGPQACFSPADRAQHVLSGGIAPLPDIGSLSIVGADSRSFLHAQLTNDIEHLQPGQVQWNGYCTAKGRLLAVARNWVSGDAIKLAMPRTLTASLRKRLAMFVLRAKAQVVDDSDTHVCFGLMGRAVPAALSRLGIQAGPADTSTHRDALTVLHLHPLSVSLGLVERYLLICPAEQAGAVWQTLTDTDSSDSLWPLNSQDWRWAEVSAGEPRIVGGGVEQFVPQMVNFDLIGGVNFKKGCYPGQEVVARSHYLGKLKRRMFLAETDAGTCPAPGSDVLARDQSEPCGQVVLAAESPFGGIAVLYESQIASALNAHLPDGRLLLPLELPYAVPV